MTQTWEERERDIHRLFMEYLGTAMGAVTQAELATKMGGGVRQKDISRWLSGDGPKMTPGRFGTAIKALGGDPAKAFGSVVETAKTMGLFTPGEAAAKAKQSPVDANVISLASKRQAEQEAEADRIHREDDKGRVPAAARDDIPD